MLSLRNSHNPSELDQLSVEITNRVTQLGCVEGARTISTYLHTGSEVRTKQIVDWALSQGKRVIVPVTIKAEKQLFFSELRAPEVELEKGAFGIPEPKPQFRRPVALEEADVALVPGIAWDKGGYRIGYGGYYDRSLNSVRKHVNTVGLAFEFQIVNTLPRTRYDRHVDKLVTDHRTIDTTDGSDF
jgi:5-formyltetrahydrofolate cyclo-ligase